MSTSAKRAPKKRNSKAERRVTDSTRLAKAMSHPLRSQILAALNENVASPKDLADSLGEPLGNVAYHVRTLLDLDCVELVDTAQRRGAIEHYYRATTRPMMDGAAWAALPATLRHGFSAEWFKTSFEDAYEAISAGTFAERSDGHLSFTQLTLDEEGWARLGHRLAAALDEAMADQAKAAPRLAKAPDEAIRARLMIAQYTAPPSTPKRKKK
jgi:DNA-binding transcriptional ArsR family regulator